MRLVIVLEERQIDFVVERESNDRIVNVFKGKNIKTGETEEFKGIFERVNKKKAKK